MTAPLAAQAHHHRTDGPVTCLNCAHTYTGRYCSHCGQRADTHPVNWHYLWHEIPHSIWHLDRGMLFTVKELLTRPGHTIREFLEGKRVNHYRPLALLLFLGTIYIFTYKGLGVNLTKMGVEAGQNLYGKPKVNASAHVQAEVTQFQDNVMHFIEDKQTYMMILMIPFLAFGYWLLFRRRGYNYPEFVVTQTFIANFNLLSSTLTIGLFWMLGVSDETFRTIMGFSIIVPIAYSTLTYYQFFKKQISLIGVFIRSAVAYVVGYVSFVLIMGIIGAAVGLGMGYKASRTAPATKTPVTTQHSH